MKSYDIFHNSKLPIQNVFFIIFVRLVRQMGHRLALYEALSLRHQEVLTKRRQSKTWIGFHDC